MAAATTTNKQLMKPQVLKNESKGQLGKNWLVEMQQISITVAGTFGSATLTSDIANPQFVSFCQTAGAGALTDFPVVTITPATGTAKATILVSFITALTDADKVIKVKIEGY